MKNDTPPKTIKRSEYRAPDFLLDGVDLHFDLEEEYTRVQSRLEFRKNPDNPHQSNTLRLDGEGLKLLSIELDGNSLDPARYSVDDVSLTIEGVKDTFVVEIETECDPKNNTRLEGLYKSSGNFCTQCEAQGFRRITYFLDRPDVMSIWSVAICADKKRYPVMLSNGNQVDSKDFADGRHSVRWEDPFPKPSYLFALVAGDLACISDKFTTASGRIVDLKIYVESHNKDKCAFAMQSLKKSMAWDESRFGLEYDLDIYMIVAVDDFNMGAMENKGLNVFNSKFVLADQQSATDTDFQGVESVIGHEYFHNWTGNRVTCRDWFQLSLKEGLTVFRDQEFSSDMNARAVKRIHDVRQLQARQFPEDASPMAHPIRPDAYIEINNFYTATVYEKGAEVIRMIHTLLGEAHFRKGMDLYFERHDGQAVTCEDFVSAMEDASGHDLKQFRNWYSQAGTPTLEIESTYDANAAEYHLTVRQMTKTHPQNLPFHVPLAIGLLDKRGEVMPLQISENAYPAEQLVLNVRQETETFRFINIRSEPVPSLLRNFSAPVHLSYNSSDDELAFLMQFDSDSFNSWESGQRLATRIIESEMTSPALSEDIDAGFSTAFARLLEGGINNAALRAEALTLPGLDAIAELQDVVDVDAIFSARQAIRHRLAKTHRKSLLNLYRLCAQNRSDDLDPQAMGLRRLGNVSLHYLTALETSTWKALVLDQYNSGFNMTDTLAALNELSHSDLAEREEVLDGFYQKWQGNRLVIDKWFAIQALSQRSATLDEVRRLTGHADFDTRNPNRVRALISTFATGNPLRFHAIDGSGYRFLTDYIIRLDKHNPQLTSRMTTPLSRWKRYDKTRQSLMLAQLERIANTAGLSVDVFEVVSKSMQGAA